MLYRYRPIVILVAAFSCSVRADVLFVDAGNCPGPGDGSELDPYCSIQTAIDDAVDTDEIVVAPGTYFETINFLGKAIWLHSSDGAEVTTIDGTGSFHVVQCVNGEGSDTVLSGFVITGGNADDFPSDDNGGGMYNSRSSPTVLKLQLHRQYGLLFGRRDVQPRQQPNGDQLLVQRQQRRFRRRDVQ